ncbi:MAG: DUF3151 family protein [Bifidobacteriaceae bacterium]|jgi:hypothetical protein|nr:DUF3151 family protein [Bifidobacteriaceae bacterium]
MPAAARPSHQDQVARAEHQAGADLGSVVAGHVDSAWAWGAWAAEALDAGDTADAYARAFLGHVVGFRELKSRGWAEGQPVHDPVLLSALILGLASEALGDQRHADRSRDFLAQLGHRLDDPALLDRLRR